MTSHDHVITGVAKGGLISNYFLAHNSPQASTCPLAKTMVWILARPQRFKVHATSIPEMLRDHQSPNLDGTI